MSFQRRKKVKAYVDGSCSGNPGKGGWGVVLLGENDDLIESNYGSEEYTTNNRMELKGVLKALEMTGGYNIVEIYTDSAYVVDCMRKKWYETWIRNGWRTKRKEPVKNKDLWEAILEHTKNGRGKQISFHKIKGHTDYDVFNNLADFLAKQGSRGGK